MEIETCVLHEHPLTLCEKFCPGCGNTLWDHYLDEVRRNCWLRHVRCAACDEMPSDEFYVCKTRWPNNKSPVLHKSCAELPQVIEISSHPHSYLQMQSTASSEKRAWRRCQFCYRDIKGLHKFCCDECGFEICWACPKSLLKYHEGRDHVKHFEHKHPLTLLMVNNLDCSLCKKKCQGPAYGCVPCNFFIHKSCYELPCIIRHPFHPGHWLSLDRSFNYRCSACCWNGEGIRYQCSYCRSDYKREIDLHPECRFLKASIKYEGHEHLLTFVENLSFKSECQACGCEIQGTFFARCVECRLDFHLQCDGPLHLPATIVHEDGDGHDPLILNIETSSVRDDTKRPLQCNVCKKVRDPAHPYYYCAESEYYAHVGCVVSEVKAEREKLRHFSHQHFLIPLDHKHKNDDDDDDFFCSACSKGIEDAQTYYGCESCKFYLHRSCAELPKEINHRFHKHSLALRQTNSAGKRCDGCGV